MECRFQRFNRSLVSKPTDSAPPTPTTPQSKPVMKDPIESIIEMTYLMNSSPEDEVDETMEHLIASFIKNPESVLQDIDIHRLRAIIYRDVVRQNRNKSGKNVVIVVVNLSNIFLCFLYFVLHLTIFLC